MDVMNSERLRHICDDVWRERAAILSDRGILSGEAALVRAVYWRLCKAGDSPPPQNSDDYAPSLKNLLRRYRDEVAQT
jgi:hypothetical protein